MCINKLKLGTVPLMSLKLLPGICLNFSGVQTIMLWHFLVSFQAGLSLSNFSCLKATKVVIDFNLCKQYNNYIPRALPRFSSSIVKECIKVLAQLLNFYC